MFQVIARRGPQRSGTISVHRQVLDAIRALPSRQREALALRFYLDMSEDEAARAMGVSKGTIKSATSRAVAAVGRLLQEES